MSCGEARTTGLKLANRSEEGISAMASLYSTKVTASGGRHGSIRSEDGLLDLKLAFIRFNDHSYHKYHFCDQCRRLSRMTRRQTAKSKALMMKARSKQRAANRADRLGRAALLCGPSSPPRNFFRQLPDQAGGRGAAGGISAAQAVFDAVAGAGLPALAHATVRLTAMFLL
jgi:hypothetical protein